MPNKPNKGNEQNSRNSTKDDSPKGHEKIWNWLFEGKAAVWTAIFTGVLTVFTYMLYRVNDQTNDTARATQRAFLNFNGIAGGVGLVQGNPKVRTAQELIINWNNSGTTPARHAVTNVSGQPWPSELPDGFDFHDLSPEKIPIAIGPRETTGVRLAIPIEALRSSREGKARIFFWGWVVYDDLFPGDPTRLTEFCAELIQVTIPADKDINDPNTPIGWNYNKCRQHNCYDQDCPDYDARIKTAQAK